MGRSTIVATGSDHGGQVKEAFWDHTFNGVKDENPWADLVPPERLANDPKPAQIFGIPLPWAEGGDEPDLRRPFMARFGDIARVEARDDGVRGVIERGAAYDPTVRVTLKSGTAFDLDRLSASDFDDGVRVWDEARGVVDLGPREIRTIELFAPDAPREVPDRLHGTVRTRQGDFAGAIQWDREASLGRDVLVGRTAEGERRLRFAAIRSIVRQPREGALVATRDGREIVLSGREVGPENRGVYVDDPRYGRVLVSWEVFERIDFGSGGRGPAYDDFPPGRPLTGRVTTRDGRRLAGQLVFDLDESETTETLDAPAGGVDYIVPFGRIGSIALPDSGGRARVTLWSGEELQLERSGDLADGNGGMLIVGDDPEQPEYVPWAEVAWIDLDPPAEPSAGARQ